LYTRRFTETDELADFVNHRQPDWKIPLYQQVLDWGSGLAFLVTVFVLAGYAICNLSARRRGPAAGAPRRLSWYRRSMDKYR